MKNIIFFLSLNIGISANVFAQINEKINCTITETRLGLNSFLYENVNDKIIKVYSEDDRVVETYLISESDENNYSYDTITSQNPIEELITTYDERIYSEDFESIDLRSFTVHETNKLLFEKEIDFMGDSNPDRIEITTSNFGGEGKQSILINLYEYRNNRYEICKDCIANFWSTPLKLYVSKVKHHNMSVLIFILEKKEGDWGPENSAKIEMIYAGNLQY